MIVHLMFEERDFDPNARKPCCHEDLISDLGLNILLEVMSGKDEFIYRVCEAGLLQSLTEPHRIIYRQDVLKDCLKNRSRIEELYSLSNRALEKKKSVFFWTMNRSPSSVLSSSVRLMEMLMESLVELKRFSVNSRRHFSSRGFSSMFNTTIDELTDEYFNELRIHLKNLELRSGVLFGARLGKGNRGRDYRLKKQKDQKGWKLRLKKTDSYTFKIHERDESGFRALSELKDKGLRSVAETLFKSVNHVFGFFETLKTELGFYIGALNLHDKLSQLNRNICFPSLNNKNRRSFKGLYNPVLAITLNRTVVGNELDVEEKLITFVTGANQGGKTVFLGSMGIAQLLMQAGLFVCADSYSSYPSNGIFTHYKREEDRALQSGKLDEELSRLSKITDHLKKGSLVLFNESFASTNEYEGSEIAIEILRAFMENGIESIYVTHMYRLVSYFYTEKTKAVCFLVAERTENGKRTYKVVPGKPSPTSHGIDIYRSIF